MRLVEVGGGELPGFGGEVDVVAVVDLGEVVKAVGLLWVGQCVGAPVVVDRDPALLDVDVRRPVLAHGAQLHQVAVRVELLWG